MSFIDTIFAKLRRHPKRIVFPDGDDPRVVRACHAFYEKKVGIPVLIGNREVIERVAVAEKVSLDHVAIVNPETSSDLPVFCERFEKIDRYKKIGTRDTRSLMTNPNYFAAMMLQFGQVDALGRRREQLFRIAFAPAYPARQAAAPLAFHFRLPCGRSSEQEIRAMMACSSWRTAVLCPTRTSSNSPLSRCRLAWWRGRSSEHVHALPC